MNLFDLIAIVAALYLFARVLDRLRLINWKTTRALYVGTYLCHALWVLGLAYSVAETGMRWHQAFGLAAMFCWLQVTRQHWLEGVPEEATKPGQLGVPELDHFK